MRRLMVLICLAVAVPATTAGPGRADVTGPNGKIQDCYCTDQSGARIELGETICLDVGGRMFMAQCQMSLNVPMWREIRQGCLTSRLGPLQRPAPQMSVGPERG